MSFKSTGLRMLRESQEQMEKSIDGLIESSNQIDKLNPEILTEAEMKTVFIECQKGMRALFEVSLKFFRAIKYMGDTFEEKFAEIE